MSKDKLGHEWRSATSEDFIAMGMVNWCETPEAKPVIAEMADDLAKHIDEEVFRQIMGGGRV